MKKIILLITILFVSVISTACINNLAVQELNNKAKEYMEKGETDKAISRLRSSIDLDTSIFETHYNLGVALIQAKDYEEAITSLKNAVNLKPDFADSYYSLAIAYEGLADKIINGIDKESLVSDENPIIEEKINLTESQKIKVVELLNAAIHNYNQYIVKKPEEKNNGKIEEQINYINKQILEYNSLNNDTQITPENISTSSKQEIDD